jgi:hypothetical protein
VRLDRGFRRVGISAFLVWVAFWTWAYVMRPIKSASAPSTLPTLSWSDASVYAPLALAVAIVLVRWIIAGFRSNS